MTSTPRPPHLLSREEDCLLKTALAFVVLRNRIGNKRKAANTNDEDSVAAEQTAASNGTGRTNQRQSPPAFLRGLLPQNNATSSRIDRVFLPSDKDHLERMIRVAVTTARGLYQTKPTGNSSNDPDHNEIDSKNWVYQVPSQQLENANDDSTVLFATLDGLTNHLASQLRAAATGNNKEGNTTWLENLIRTSLLEFSSCRDVQDCLMFILATCTVWHGIHHWGSGVGLLSIRVIGKVLQEIYKDELWSEMLSNDRDEKGGKSKEATRSDNHVWTCTSSSSLPSIVDVLTVNLIHLLEQVVDMTLQQGNNTTLLEQVPECLGGPDLFLPVPMCDLAYFYHTHQQQQQGGNGHSHLTPGGKLMMRLCFWDLIQKLSSHQPQNTTQMGQTK